MQKFAIGASVLAVGYLLFHPEQPSHYVHLQNQPVGNIQTADPDRPEAQAEKATREPSGKMITRSYLKIVFEK